MKLSAALKAALKNNGGNLRKKSKHQQLGLKIIASLLLLGGFFYSLGYLVFLKAIYFSNSKQLKTTTSKTISFPKSQREACHIQVLSLKLLVLNRAVPSCHDLKPDGLTNLKISIRQKNIREKIIPTVLAQKNIQTSESSFLAKDIVCELSPFQASFKNNLPLKKIDQLCSKKLANSDGQILDTEDNKIKDELKEILKGTPMETMIDSISKQDQVVASFLVGIALKESGLGFHAPHKNGKDCYNYWGFKGKENPTVGGYSCFDSPEQAVSAVGERLEKLVTKNIDTPGEMVVWKCGSSCEGHSTESVSSWIGTVAKIFYKLNTKNTES